ncbi:hypothetical protein DPX16_17372 [Anabarilius grahami]|uniref:Reverse transcriptase zinc-binding domain-containing protein n=1 Tax=Anabarilius grahami TaxID=495550 RepID=A0A3N0XYS7_ANAGA|nr:hypothetical protein DPX16_17372 [Anabarilius grahami]
MPKVGGEDQHVRAVGLASQGQWMQKDQALDCSLSWKELWSADQGKLTFLLLAAADLLPTPNNLNIWGKDEDPSCYQCGAALCTLNHILIECSCHGSWIHLLALMCLLYVYVCAPAVPACGKALLMFISLRDSIPYVVLPGGVLRSPSVPVTSRTTFRIILSASHIHTLHTNHHTQLKLITRTIKDSHTRFLTLLTRRGCPWHLTRRGYPWHLTYRGYLSSWICIGDPVPVCVSNAPTPPPRFCHLRREDTPSGRGKFCYDHRLFLSLPGLHSPSSSLPVTFTHSTLITTPSSSSLPGL